MKKDNKIVTSFKKFFSRSGKSSEIKAYFPTGGSYEAEYDVPVNTRYTAEKNPGELGTIKKYYLDFDAVRNRAWQAYLESDVVQAIVQKMTSWVAGRGLRLEPTPMRDLLKEKGITLEDGIEKKIQKTFGLFKNSKSSVYGKEVSLNKKSVSAYLNTFVGGDCLVILHISNGKLQVECVDGQHVYSPVLSDVNKLKSSGNTVSHGIETNQEGEHIAYYVRRKSGHKRILARSKTGLRVAYMVYSNLEYRYSTHRGLSEIAAILESVKKLDRYREAAVGGAEERAKIAFTIEHAEGSTGVNPLGSQLRGSVRSNSTVSGASETPDDGSIKAAAKIALTTGKQAINLPNGASMKAVSSDMEINFKEFYMTNLQIACSAVDLPVEVALSKFESSFSSSRGAMKMFERTVDEKREDWVNQFWKPIYTAWMYLEDLRSDLNLNGLFTSVTNGDDMTIEAYVSMKMTGPKIPHVDPVKEVEAVRRKLGKKAENVPLISIQEAVEEIGSAIDFESFSHKFMDQVRDFIDEEPKDPTIKGGGNKDD